MNTIRIFIASSSELEQDRKEFRQFLSVENDRLHTQNVYLKLVQWEHFLDTVSQTRLQDEYNDALKTCDIVICLFFTRAGRYTQEEFDTALKQFKETGKPLIYTYFKTGAAQASASDEQTRDLEAFKERLSGIGHFSSSYANIDDLKLRFRRQLDLLEEKGFVKLRDEVKEKTKQAVLQYFNTAIIGSTLRAAHDITLGDVHHHYGEMKIPHHLTRGRFSPKSFSAGRRTFKPYTTDSFQETRFFCS